MMGTRQCGGDVRVQRGHGDATGTWVCNRDTDMQWGHSMWQAHRHGMGTRACSKDMDVSWDVVMWGCGCTTGTEMQQGRRCVIGMGTGVCDGDIRDMAHTGDVVGTRACDGTADVQWRHGHGMGTQG